MWIMAYTVQGFYDGIQSLLFKYTATILIMLQKIPAFQILNHKSIKLRVAPVVLELDQQVLSH